MGFGGFGLGVFGGLGVLTGFAVGSAEAPTLGAGLGSVDGSTGSTLGFALGPMDGDGEASGALSHVFVGGNGAPHEEPSGQKPGW